MAPKNIKIEDKNGLAFIKEVAKYFMDFLETDFHKRKNPKRSIQFKSSNNLLVGLNLNKYPSFNNLVNKAINHAFDKNTLNTIQKGVYRTKIPKNLLDLVKLQTEKITNKQISKILKLIAGEIEKSATLYKKEYDQALNASLEAVAKILKTELVLPFVGNIEKPLENLNLGDENNIYLMEEELTAVLSSPLENKVSEVIKLLLAKEKIDISKQLKDVFEIADIKLNIHSFFESFQVSDLFAEIYEMERNRTILDKQEFYLYFCDITFNNAKFPIFYIPVVIEKQNEVLTIEFDSQVYINKKALEYITQGYNQEKGKKGNLKTILERIIYLAQHQNDFRDIVSEILSEITNFFELDKNIDINNPEQQIAKSFLIRVSNNCYLALFDKSDEALVNDYEEILKLLIAGDSVLGEAFNKLIDDFIHKDPKKYNIEIQEEWNDQDVPSQLVFQSPIPLNGEQLQILSAIKRDDCKYIIVQGPPGTGKSHTITAVVFNLILKNKSILVLSDKKEALDVVEDKITETMNKVRVDDSFQNPVLRLGKTGNAYAKILSPISIKSIIANWLAVKKNYKSVEENIEKSENSLKEDIEAEILANNEIDLKEIHEYFDLESYYVNKGFPVDIDEVLDQAESAIELEEFKKIFLSLKDKLIIDQDKKEKETKLFELLNFSINDFNDISNFQKYLWLLNFLSSSVDRIKKVYTNDLSLLSTFDTFDEPSLKKLSDFITDYEEERNWLFGYLLKKKKIENLDKKFKKSFNLTSQIEPHKNLEDLKKVLGIYQFVEELKTKLNEKYQINFDYLRFIHQTINDGALLGVLNNLMQIGDDLKFLNTNLPKYPNTIKKLKIDLSSFKTFCSNDLVKISDIDFDRLIRFINLKQKIENDFKNIPSLNYNSQKKNIENLLTVKMTHIMDGRLVEFWDKHQSTATALKKIIQGKLKFPQEEFLKLKDAFPCILAGIRDYAEYIPLEPEIFDLVIIDEASQVSIAQAFPALLRAKKVLILGDKKQFSNVKTAQARTDTNREYLNNLKDSFIKCVASGGIRLEKLKNFNIKTSVLEFFEYISNYNTQLLKHFRGYKEIISYSNKYFYQDSLQVMKIRGKAIDDVIKFSFINHDGKKELAQNTNSLEAEFIISELKKLKEIDSNQSVGIITPHTNQQKLLVELISKIPEKDYFYDKLKLKIMTFDTCQGEERDIIFYSMVATEEDDHLWGVFIKDLNDVDIEEEGKIRAQRLNVGLSRAKETMHFILSKPLEKYNGSIGEALRHYSFMLSEAKQERSVSEVDKKSKMEPEVMNWFYQTDFWKKNKESIEFIPQFELGKYLKQLDKTYNHPNYKIDFLLVYKDETHKEHKIIIEYDGFREHFKDIDEVNEFNYQDYYTDEDVYRQKALEGYGYKFLRINKFNIGKDPISTFNKRIGNLIKNDAGKNNVISHIHETIEGLQNGEMKECPKCKKIRDYKDFRDPDLITGYGRFCMHCKGYTLIEKSADDTNNHAVISGEKICPKCGSKMILRTGRYGKFYGCSKFPYCRGTSPS
ncbi:topoisomerase DNA-binding C4 zinc finger domain-containing protein [Patescibacteria group bacterium]|nr:topoisomerase DNA-binding C4 zinc finger domain-containing protein [Patescibacteria group bacterium]MBU4467109.1 topoisomerase DNA-binding C4 zinc finger domain-containing protein [Patescibacteria group bacterium]MCG2699787.1 AAA domain-containing protein [Candidatus Parcubacteria bacterium]